MKRISLGLLALALILPAAGAAKTVRATGVEGFCATRVSTTAISYARHKFNQSRRELETRDRFAVGKPGVQNNFTVTKQKNIAVVEDDGTIFPPPNLFDLGPTGVQFKWGGAGTRAEVFLGGVSSTRGDRIEIGDDASRTIDLPFPFTFYGTTYNRVFLNSDGNLTFNQAESASTPRSLGRFLEGPPRIALDFVDLDPNVTSGEAGVYLLEQAGMVRVTWLRVPQFGLSDSNTMQVTLYPSGRITMGYDNVAAQDGVVGVSPGGPGTINLVDLSQQLPIKPKQDAIAEQFRTVSEIDDMAAASAVLSRVRDEYDLLVLFADFPVDLDGAFAYNAPIRNDIRGIGDAVGYNFSHLYGSKGRLEAFVQMGSLDKYPFGPNNFIGLSEAPGIGILAHEVGHRWLAFPAFINQGQRSTDLLGRQLAHWSFLLDTDGSVMEGNNIRDNGDGTFTTTATWQGFSKLDQYLMGFLRPDQVPSFFYVTGSELDPARAPESFVAITGQRRNVNVNQIIAAEGPRIPNAANSQKVIQVAFVLLGRQGEPPGLDSVRKMNQYRNRLSTYFREHTAGRGRIATWLRLRKNAQVAPAAAEPALAGG
ncbi:MAG: hypothetical protein ACE5EG_05095, partial [Thermoanaerobaculia bacterium]